MMSWKIALVPVSVVSLAILTAPVRVAAEEAAAKPAAGAAVTGAAATPSPGATGTPKIVMGETTFNGGDVAKGDSIDHDFTVKNTGTADLQILSVKPACGCTTPGFDKIVPPGGTGKISLKIDTARLKGPISKAATVTTNDPEQSTVKLVVNANVQTFIDLMPRDSVFFRQYRGEVKKEEVTVKSNEAGPFKINDVQVTGEGVKYELTPPAEGTSEYKLAVWIDKTVPIGNVEGSVKLLTNSAKEPEVTIAVRGTVLGQINLNPSTLYFRVDTTTREVVANSNSLNVRERGELAAAVVAKVGKDERLTVVEEAGEWMKVQTASKTQGWVYTKLVEPAPAAGSAEQTKVINVTHRQATAFKITETAVEGASLSTTNVVVKTEPVSEGQSYRVTVTYGGGLAKGNYSGSVVLKTSDKEEPEVKVPLYIVVS